MWVANELFVDSMRRLREEAVRQARLVSEALRAAEQEPSQRAWRWRVEPGMESAFTALLGWLLSSQRDAEIETTGQAAPTNALPWWGCCPYQPVALASRSLGCCQPPASPGW